MDDAKKHGVSICDGFFENWVFTLNRSESFELLGEERTGKAVGEA